MGRFPHWVGPIFWNSCSSSCFVLSCLCKISLHGIRPYAEILLKSLSIITWSCWNPFLNTGNPSTQQQWLLWPTCRPLTRGFSALFLKICEEWSQSWVCFCSTISVAAFLGFLHSDNLIIRWAPLLDSKHTCNLLHCCCPLLLEFLRIFQKFSVSTGQSSNQFSGSAVSWNSFVSSSSEPHPTIGWSWFFLLLVRNYINFITLRGLIPTASIHNWI